MADALLLTRGHIEFRWPLGGFQEQEHRCIRVPSVLFGLGPAAGGPARGPRAAGVLPARCLLAGLARGEWPEALAGAKIVFPSRGRRPGHGLEAHWYPLHGLSTMGLDQAQRGRGL